MIDIFLIIILSFITGLLGALTGLGGASIMVPLLTLLGVPIKYAIAAGMVTVIATSSGSAASYVERKLTNVKAAMYLEIYTVIGAILGAIITSFISSKLLYFFFASFLITSFIGLKGHLSKELPIVNKQDKISKLLNLEGSYFDEALGKEVDYKLTNAIQGGLGMFIAGLAAGMLGIGAGAFKVSVHELILKMPSKVSSTTSNFIIGMTALAGSTIYLKMGLIHVNLVAPMAIGTTIGAILGARILNKFRNVTIRYLFLAIVLYLIIQMLYKGMIAPW
jgi:uncharacterized membrane protein YfcA